MALPEDYFDAMMGKALENKHNKQVLGLMLAVAQRENETLRKHVADLEYEYEDMKIDFEELTDENSKQLDELKEVNTIGMIFNL